MTQNFLLDFEQRRRQVRHYLAVVATIERQAKNAGNRSLEGRLLVLRAGAFLVMYNLVEASIRASIEAIHDKITTSDIQFSALVLSLRRESVRWFKRKANPTEHHTFEDFPAAFVAVALVLEDQFSLSGSVDSRAIRHLGECYGFSCDTSAPTRGGSDLLSIKRNRNDLAHGLKTYEEVGRDFTATDLILLARRAMRYVAEILKNVDEYLEKGGYLENAAM
jgi:hypothetical protein